MREIELLAPAGDMNSLYAAVQTGANAVYIGGSHFSARANAANFDDESIVNAINYCHQYGVKIYITLNTLIKEKELKEALNFLKFIYNSGVDAVIIQDTGLAFLIKKYFPDFELHASTQMTIHNGDSARFLVEKGFKRIVLSRELSLKEIRDISKDSGIETEIFIHGALCICYSGQCLMSSLIGGRSGNRGRCAQPCRLPYTIINKDNFMEKSGYILSPKDICMLEDIGSIMDSGAASLKIEGRMKKPEYVAGVVDVYRRAIDNFAAWKKADGSSYEKDYRTLLKLFSREGFSKAYLYKNTGASMMAYSLPKNTGTVLGKVNEDGFIELVDNIALRDGLRIGMGNNGFTVEKIYKNNCETEEAFALDKVKIRPDNYHNGDIIYKTFDSNLNNKLEMTYKNKYGKKLSLPLEIEFKTGEKIKLTTYFGNECFTTEGEVIQTAVNRPLDKEKVLENLRKQGDTPFYFGKINVLHFESGFLNVASINAARRTLINIVEEYAVKKYKHNYEANITLKNLIYDNQYTKQNSSLMVLVNTFEQFKAAKESGLCSIAVNLFNRGEKALKLEQISGEKIHLFVPGIIKEEYDRICGIIENIIKSKDNTIEGIVTSNLGIIDRFSKDINITGDYKLNVFNSYAGEFYKDTLEELCISVELNKKEIYDICKNSSFNFQVMVYGKIELMTSEYCPIGSALGGKNENKPCANQCKKGTHYLRDRKNEEFLIKTDTFCRSHIFNFSPLNLINEMNEMENIGIHSFRADFIDENYSETMKIIKALKEKIWSENLTHFTRGHYRRGVE